MVGVIYCSRLAYTTKFFFLCASFYVRLGCFSSLTAVLVGIRVLAWFLQRTESYSSGLKLCYKFKIYVCMGIFVFPKATDSLKAKQRHFVESRRQKCSMETAEFAEQSTSFLPLQRVTHRQAAWGSSRFKGSFCMCRTHAGISVGRFSQTGVQRRP